MLNKSCLLESNQNNTTSRITGRPRHNKNNTLIFHWSNLNNISVKGRKMMSELKTTTTTIKSLKWNLDKTLHPYSQYNVSNNIKSNNRSYSIKENDEQILRLRRFSPKHYLDVHKLKNRLGMLKMSRCCKRSHSKVGFVLKSSPNNPSELMNKTFDRQDQCTMLSLTEVFPFSENLRPLNIDESDSIPMMTPMDKARITSEAIRDQLEDILDLYWNMLHHRRHDYRKRDQERATCQPPPPSRSTERAFSSHLDGDDSGSYDSDVAGKSERATAEEVLLVLKHFLSMGPRKSALNQVCRLISDNIAPGSYHHRYFFSKDTIPISQRPSLPLKDIFRYILIDLVNLVNKKHSTVKTMRMFMVRLLSKLRAQCEQLDDVFVSVLAAHGKNDGAGYELLRRLSYTPLDVEQLITLLRVNSVIGHEKSPDKEEFLSESSDVKPTAQSMVFFFMARCFSEHTNS